MGPQRYERVRITTPPFAPRGLQDTPRLTMPCPQVAEHDDDDNTANTSSSPQPPYPIPASPPPSFHSRASSPAAASRRLLSDDPLANDADGTLADTFDADSDDDDETDDRQRLMRGTPEDQRDVDDGTLRPVRPGRQRSVTQLPVFNTTSPAGGRIYGGGQNDGVFANLSAKPTRGEDAEEKPPVRALSYKLQPPPHR